MNGSESMSIVSEKRIQLNSRVHVKKLIKKFEITKLANWTWSIARFLLLLGLGFVIIYPLLRTISRTFTPVAQYADQSVIWIPKSLTLDNIFMSIKALDYWNTLGRTIVLSMGCAILQIISCSVVGYGFARFRFKLNGPLFALVILTIIVPSQVTFIPTYMQFRFFDFFGLSRLLSIMTGTDASKVTVNLLNTNMPFFLTSFFGVGIRSGLFIYIYRQCFKSIPKALEEAASIDGCSVLRTFWQIMAPNAKATSLTVFLFSVVWHWNEYTLTNTYFKTGNRPLSVAIQSVTEAAKQVVVTGGYQGVSGAQIANAIAYGSVILFLIPPIILYIFAQKFFVQGVESSGIKD